MTRTEMQTFLKARFLGFDGLENLTYTDKTTSGGSSQTVSNARITFQVTKSFGQSAVRGYQIDSVGVTFPVDSLTVTAKEGDTVVVDGNTYEVTKAELKTARTRWMVVAERAFIETDFATTCDIQRATLSVNSAGAPIETYADTTSGVSVIVMNEDDVSDQIAKLGVRGDVQSISFFMAQSVTVLPTDRIEYASRFYRINSIIDEGRVARLKRIRCQIYP